MESLTGSRFSGGISHSFLSTRFHILLYILFQLFNTRLIPLKISGWELKQVKILEIPMHESVLSRLIFLHIYSLEFKSEI